MKIAHSWKYPFAIIGLAALFQPMPVCSTESIEPLKAYGVVEASSLNLRSGPGLDYPITKVLYRGMHLHSMHQLKEDWLRIQLVDGEEGWTDMKYIHFYVPDPFPFRNLSDSPSSYDSLLEGAVHLFLEDVQADGTISPQDRLSLVVQDLQTNRQLVAINADLAVKAASLIKVPILHAYMIQQYQNKVRHSWTHQQNLIEMIQHSNNASTNRILGLLGGPAPVQKLLTDTRMYHHLFLTEYIPANGKTYLNKISANDMSRLLLAIWSRNTLGNSFEDSQNGEASQRMLHLLGLPSVHWKKDRLKDGTCFSDNQSVKVYDKTGYVKGLNGNAGIIEINTPHGSRAYSIVSIVERSDQDSLLGDGSQWASNQSQVMRKISEIVYSYFSNYYESFDLCGRDRFIDYASRVMTSNKSSQVSHIPHSSSSAN